VRYTIKNERKIFTKKELLRREEVIEKRSSVWKKKMISPVTN